MPSHKFSAIEGSEETVPWPLMKRFVAWKKRSRRSQIVKLRFFMPGVPSVEETADAMKISARTVKRREWQYARGVVVYGIVEGITCAADDPVAWASCPRLSEPIVGETPTLRGFKR